MLQTKSFLLEWIYEHIIEKNFRKRYQEAELFPAFYTKDQQCIKIDLNTWGNDKIQQMYSPVQYTKMYNFKGFPL